MSKHGGREKGGKGRLRASSCALLPVVTNYAWRARHCQQARGGGARRARRGRRRHRRRNRSAAPSWRTTSSAATYRGGGGTAGRLRWPRRSSASILTASCCSRTQRRPRFHRHGETVHAATRGEYHHHLHQQRLSRHDRRADGAHLAAQPGHADLAVRARRGDRRYPCAFARCSPPSTAWRTSSASPSTRLKRSQGEEGFEEGLRKPGRRRGLLPHRGRFMPDQLGPHASGRVFVDAREHAAVLSARRVQRRRRGRFRERGAGCGGSQRSMPDSPS